MCQLLLPLFPLMVHFLNLYHWLLNCTLYWELMLTFWWCSTHELSDHFLFFTSREWQLCLWCNLWYRRERRDKVNWELGDVLLLFSTLFYLVWLLLPKIWVDDLLYGMLSSVQIPLLLLLPWLKGRNGQDACSPQ